MRSNRSNKGFTLIELLIVIAIIGILAAVLIPNLLGARTRAYDTATQACARSVATAQEVFAIDSNTGDYAASMDQLDEGMISGCAAPVSVAANGDYESGWAVTHANAGTRTFTVSPSGIEASGP